MTVPVTLWCCWCWVARNRKVASKSATKRPSFASTRLGGARLTYLLHRRGCSAWLLDFLANRNTARSFSAFGANEISDPTVKHYFDFRIQSAGLAVELVASLLMCFTVADLVFNRYRLKWSRLCLWLRLLTLLVSLVSASCFGWCVYISRRVALRISAKLTYHHFPRTLNTCMWILYTSCLWLWYNKVLILYFYEATLLR